MLRSNSKQSGESMQSVVKKKGRLQWKGFAEKEGFLAWGPIYKISYDLS